MESTGKSAVLACGHAQNASRIGLCRHLVGQGDVAFWRVLRGAGMRYDCCCELCKKAFENGEKLEFVEVCDACARAIDGELWKGHGWLGEPQILEAPLAFDDALEIVVFAPALGGASVVMPLDARRVVALCGDEICVFEGDSFSVLGKIEIPDDKDENWGEHHLTPRFYGSPSGRFVALVNDFGRYGAIFDLESARQTMNLDRGDYFPHTQFFPLAFFQNDGRDLVVHATDWNRLEISDPQNGELLTRREALFYDAETEELKAHYLDYFHGALRISPDFEWILDDGWIWHPFGQVSAWNLKAWLDNVYESEDGKSKRDLIPDKDWNLGMCWIDARRVATQGMGFYNERRIRGVTISDVVSGEVLQQFAGPSGAFWSDGTRLFSVENDGLHLWNVESGARTGILAGFRPQFHIGGALAQLEGQEMTLWKMA